MIWLLIFIAVVGFVSWLIKINSKNRLEKGLGRKVKDSELTSINAWMNAADVQQAAEKNRKE
jgi:hypothetical protein